MKRFLKKLKRMAKKAVHEAKNFKPIHYSKARYFWYREHCPIREKLILLDTGTAKTMPDNMAAMLKELTSAAEYSKYTVCITCGKAVAEARREWLKKNGRTKVQVKESGSLAYYKALATAKFLVSEDSLNFVFTKRPEQVYLNTWHGTPLMTLGKAKKADFAMMGNEQKTFFDADYIVCPNEYTMEHMIEDYMLENFCQAEILLAGYPRNEVFRNKERAAEIRKHLEIEEKQVIAYMPTWRKSTKEMDKDARTKQMADILSAWDAALSDKQVVYVKQHAVNAVPVNFSLYKNIRPFPAEYDTYEFLNAADTLVTDYSSVMFDFALTGRKIILFTHDKEEFLSIRGLHMELSELPFSKVETVEALAKELTLPKDYEDAGFLAKFCAYDKEGITKQLCRKLVFGEEGSLIETRKIPYNGKKNVVFYMGGFEKNGVTTACSNLLHNLDRTKNNYAVVYCITSVKGRQESIRVIPEDITLLSFYYNRCVTFAEQVPYMIWRGFRKTPYRFVAKVMEKLSKRSADRMFGGCRIHSVVQFSGYNDEMIGTMEQMPCNRVIYVHSDMEKEIEMRGNANRGLLSHAYKAYDSVAAVTEGMIPPAERIAEYDKEEGSKKAHVTLCRNVIAHRRILELGEAELAFDSNTVMNVEEEKLLEALASDKKKFVSIGRFSVEKGHERLIKAFERLHKEYPDTCLIIIGGHGDLWQKTVKQVEESTCQDSVFLVRYMSNPYPLLKRCDYFALSSLYEGFGLVLVEADVLGLPCFTVDITGPRGFMQKYGGLLVENSENGLLDGMQACMKGTIPKRLSVDYDQYNAEAVAQFESLI